MTRFGIPWMEAWHRVTVMPGTKRERSVEPSSASAEIESWRHGVPESECVGSVTTWRRPECRGSVPRLGRRLCRAPSRAGALPTPGGCPRFLGYVVARRHAVSGTALSRSVRAPVQRCRRFFYRAKITVKGAPSGRVFDGASAALDSDLPRKPVGTYKVERGSLVRDPERFQQPLLVGLKVNFKEDAEECVR